MTHASHYAPCVSAATIRSGWVDFSKDVIRGALLTARALLMVAGCIALVGAATMLGNEPMRARVAATAPTLLAAVLPPALAEAAPPVEAATGEVPEETARPVASTAAADSRQRFVAQYLARRYRVAEGGVRELVAVAFDIGRELDLDPTLILAVMAIESSMNPLAESPHGAQGLMQVMTSVHTEKFEAHGGEHAALDPIANIKVGAAILKDMVLRGGSIERGLQLYVGAGNQPDDGGYGARVLGERTRIMLAAAGRVEGAVLRAGPSGARAVQSEAAAIQPVTAPVRSSSPPSVPHDAGDSARFPPSV